LSTVAALNNVIANVERSVRAAASGCNDWSDAQYADAALLILNSPHSAVTKEVMEMQLGRHSAAAASANQQLRSGAAVLEALVRADALSLRPNSDWAVDIPIEAGFVAADIIVTARSPVALHCMKKMRPQLEALVKSGQCEQLQEVCTAVINSVLQRYAAVRPLLVTVTFSTVVSPLLVVGVNTAVTTAAGSSSSLACSHHSAMIELNTTTDCRRGVTECTTALLLCCLMMSILHSLATYTFPVMYMCSSKSACQEARSVSFALAYTNAAAAAVISASSTLSM
jgi:hypothetical protein